MTHGRPSVTSHISPVPLPEMGTGSQASDPCELSGQSCDHKMGYLTFYVSTIELYKILESILSEVYNAWQTRSNSNRTSSPRGSKLCSLDVLMELDDKLSAYEANVPPLLNWTKEPLQRSGSGDMSVFKRQQNVLRARYVHYSWTFILLRFKVTDDLKGNTPTPPVVSPYVHPTLLR